MIRKTTAFSTPARRRCFYGRLEYDFLDFLYLASDMFSRVLLPHHGMLTAVPSSYSFVCAAVAICYYSHQVRCNVKTTNDNIWSQVRHTNVTKGTKCSYTHWYIRIMESVFIRIVQVNLWYLCTPLTLVLIYYTSW